MVSEIYLQISNNLHKDRLYYRKFLFGQVDQFHRKTLISSAKSQVQISFAQLIQRTSLDKYTRNILLASKTLVLFCKIVCKFMTFENKDLYMVKIFIQFIVIREIFTMP